MRRLKNLGARVLWIEPLLRNVHCSQSVANYVQQMTRCFVYGFDAQCVLMARGVLDVALLEALQEAKRPLPKGRLGLQKKIDLAVEDQILTDPQPALNIKEGGDGNAHNSPTAFENAMGRITDIVSVLKQIEGWKKV